MRKFTVKDFIAYNNPCFNCNNPINFKIGFSNSEPASETSYLRPTVNVLHTEIDLLITYADAVRLYIFHKTNKIATNNPAGLEKYLSTHQLFLQSTCDTCYTQITSECLDFQLNKGFVKAAGIACERLMVSDKENLYQLTSLFATEKSHLVVDKVNRATPLSPFTLETPLLPKYRFKNKQHFLEKIKTYLLFS